LTGELHDVEASSSSAPARPASTVILARPAEAGYEVFMVRRLARAAAFADVYVFPGGSVGEADGVPDPIDGGFTGAEALDALTARGGKPPSGAGDALGFFRAAVRELFEEAGVLLARDPSGQMARIDPADAARWDELRHEVQADRVDFVALLRQECLTLDYRALAYFSHWVTPVSEPRRFDTRFFVARLPEGQSAAHCQVETTESTWVAPRAALDLAAAGELPVIFPTRKHLELLAEHPTPKDLLVFARTKPIRTVQLSRRPAEGEEPMPGPEEAMACW
jgi:8-oxo-dGTP pyrophosphatase MutT (NUDIX family)